MGEIAVTRKSFAVMSVGKRDRSTARESKKVSGWTLGPTCKSLVSTGRDYSLIRVKEKSQRVAHLLKRCPYQSRRLSRNALITILKKKKKKSRIWCRGCLRTSLVLLVSHLYALQMSFKHDGSYRKHLTSMWPWPCRDQFRNLISSPAGYNNNSI